MKGRRHSRNQWLDWVRTQPCSGLSVKAFCRKEGVSENSFYAWRRKLKHELESNGPANPFVPLTVVESAPIEVTLPCGASIRLPREKPAMRQVLSLLLELEPESPGSNR